MELGKIVTINNNKLKRKMTCIYYSMWNNIPLYVTDDYDNVYAILNKDNSCMVVVGETILNMYTAEMLESALWHEVSHLFYRDTREIWNIQYEYRADMVAVRATSMVSVINSLERALPMFKTERASNMIHSRLEQIRTFSERYTIHIESMQMLMALDPVKIRE